MIWSVDLDLEKCAKNQQKDDLNLQSTSVQVFQDQFWDVQKISVCYKTLNYSLKGNQTLKIDGNVNILAKFWKKVKAGSFPNNRNITKVRSAQPFSQIFFNIVEQLFKIKSIRKQKGRNDKQAALNFYNQIKKDQA